MLTTPHVLCVLLVVCFVGRNDGNWYGKNYWNSRYSAKGINYPSFWGIWSDTVSIKSHYFLSINLYKGRTYCSGCTCNSVLKTVSGCSGDIRLQNQQFTTLTKTSFSQPSTITKITIIDVPEFTRFEDGALDNLTALAELIVTRTGLTTFPDISATAMTKMMLADNALFFSSKTQRMTWPASLTQLSLIKNKIQYIPDGFFNGSMLQYLGISQNQLKYVPGTALEGVTSLEFLSVDQNNIRGVSKKHLSYLATSQLKHLNLSNNIIDYIAPHALSQLANLKILELHNNELTSLTMGVFSDLPNLIHLDLVKNKLTILEEDSVTDLPSLCTLRLHSQLLGSGLTNIYYNAFKNINASLINLWISDNALTSFPHGVLSEQHYSMLSNVQIDRNLISNITMYSSEDFSPQSMTIYCFKVKEFQLWNSTPAIETLQADYNRLEGIQVTDLCDLKLLKWLSLVANTLLENDNVADATFDCLETLEYLDLSETSFRRVPKMSNMAALTELRMNDCDLTTLEAGIFSDLSLTDIHMERNNIITIENGALPPSLQTMSLQGNCFRFTHENPFTNLNQLTSLYLDQNNIDYIPDTAFHNCTSLVRLHLQYNNIGWLTKVMFKDSPLTSQFYAQSNGLSCIEDGTFSHTTRMDNIYLYDNALTKIPTGGDFSSKTVKRLYLYNNRFTEIPSGAFHDLVVSYSCSIINSAISVIRKGAFKNVNFKNIFTLKGNPLKTIESGAFESSSFKAMNLNDMQITHLPTGAFRSVTADVLRLQDNDITHIEQAAFEDVIIKYDLVLRRNSLTYLADPIFANDSSIGRVLDMGLNDIIDIDSEALNGLTSVNAVNLAMNKLTEYPTAAVANKGVREIDISDNTIEELSLVAFLDQTELVSIHLRNNYIDTIRKGTLANLINLQTLDLSDNDIGYIEPGAFSGLVSLDVMDLADNEIFFFPAIPDLTSIESIDLSENKLQTFEIGAFDDQVDVYGNSSSIIKLDLSGNNDIGCDCYMYETLKKISSAIIGGNCGTASAAIGVGLGANTNLTSPSAIHFLNADPSVFICSPVNVTATTVTSNNVTVAWIRPDNITASGTMTSDSDTLQWQYNVTCTSSGGFNITVTIGDPPPVMSNVTGLNASDIVDNTTGLNTSDPSSNTTALNTSGTISNAPRNFSHTFTIDDGIDFDTEYVCTVVVIDGNTTSPPSEPGVVRTQRKQEISLNASSTDNSTVIFDWTIPITLYDFSQTHADFVGYEAAVTSKPKYVPSPFGSWLSRSDDPSSDSFSLWFVDYPGTNFVFKSYITLSMIGTVPQTHRFSSDEFFPLDSAGFDDTQKDCYGVDHNFGFTSAIRVGIVYEGKDNQTISVGGGDDLWVYLEDVLLLEVITRGNGVNIPCKKINLSPASAAGGAIITPESGVIVNGQCVITKSEPSDNVFLELEVGERYQLSIFHTERIVCSSSFFLETENIQFIIDINDEPPTDYYSSPYEDFHINGTLLQIYVADVFSEGPPFIVTVLRGNEARHFTLLDNTVANRAAALSPAHTTPNYTTVEGLSYVECSSTSSVTPEGHDTSTETFTITTDIALFTLASALDYEANNSYTVVVQVVDPGKTPPSTGTITIKVHLQDVNDNCPELNETDIHLHADPSLQSSPIATLNATDADSDVNGNVTYHISAIVETPPLDYNISMDLYREVYTRNTTLSFSITALDGGQPTRGIRATLTFVVDNSCVVDVMYGPVNYSLTVDTTTGQLRFRAPGYYIYKFECNLALGMESGHIGTHALSASSYTLEGNPCRARLNFAGFSPEDGDAHGGWTPEEDSDQWIQVFLNSTYKINKLLVQGQADEDNWVTSFLLTYSNDGILWTNYTPTSDNNTLEGNVDRNTIVTIPLDPEIVAKGIRIYPLTWHNHVGLRIELYGCSMEKFTFHRTTCERCLTTNYCTGYSTSLPCGRCDPPQANSTCGRSVTEHSFGLASECTTCPIGWLCNSGYVSPCPDHHYVNCTDYDCPDTCYPCEPGYACREGQRYQCRVGKYSDGNSDYCPFCEAGYYQDEKGQSICKACPPGYRSIDVRDRCKVCPTTFYLELDMDTCWPCSELADCQCLYDDNIPCFSANQCYNYRTGPGNYSHGCLSCPPGFIGDGATCTDIDECAVYKPCWNTSSCMNTAPGYQCRACPGGYTGTYEDALTIDIHRRTFFWQNKVLSTENQTCTDIDECLLNHGGCDVNIHCHNTAGSYYCGECKSGYVGDSTYGCQLADFCLSGVHNCHGYADCFYVEAAEFRCECRLGWAGNGVLCGPDTDGDGIPDKPLSCDSDSCKMDNCMYTVNGGQEDQDGDRLGDVCDDDDDNDGVFDLHDNCQYVANRAQWDADGDGRGDACDNCGSDVNYPQNDVDGDGLGDVCDDDIDNDGVLNGADNCPYQSNSDQTDTDGDTVGDSCDNCPSVSNVAQTDTNQNVVGDICDGQDGDGDGVVDTLDNCVAFPNSLQTDTDADGMGDACDDDIDADGIQNSDDNCVYVDNPSQTKLNSYATRGAACDDDLDLDGIPDIDDVCPMNNNLANVTFSRYISLDLNPQWTNETSPEWALRNSGRDIRQFRTTLKPAALLGDQIFDHVILTGTTFVDGSERDGVLGFIIGYQNHRKYYLITWRRNNFNLNDRGNIRGIQIWLIDSGTSPGTTYAHALYHGCDTSGISRLLWQDPNLIGWDHRKAYRWTLQHSPSIGLLRVHVKYGVTTIVDSGHVFDASIQGGRLGVFTYNQTKTYWSSLHYRCTERLNKALQFNGSTYGEIGNVSALLIDNSFTFDAWVYLPSGHPLTKQPILCTLSGELCLYVDNRTFHGQVGQSVADGVRVITEDTWTHVAMVYDAQRTTMTIFVDGNSGGTTQDVTLSGIQEHTWNSSEILYLGRGNDSYFHGSLDEVKIYHVAIPDSDIDAYWVKFDMTREYNKCTLTAHYNMDNQTQTSALVDQGQLHIDARLYGFPVFVESMTDYHRYYDINN